MDIKDEIKNKVISDQYDEDIPVDNRFIDTDLDQPDNNIVGSLKIKNRSKTDVNVKSGKSNEDGGGNDPGVHLSTQTRILQLKNELDCIERLLVVKREEHEKRMKELEKRKQQLDEKRSQVKENYIKFNNYFEEMREKKEKALQRVKESQGFREQKDFEINRLYHELEILTKKRNLLKSKTRTRSVFDHFLQRTASHCPEEFPEVSDVIRKTDTLTDTRDILLKTQSENKASLEKLKEDYTKYVQTKSHEIIYLNLEVVELQKKVDKIQIEKMIQEKNCLHSSVMFDEKFVIIDNIIRTTENLERLIERNKRSLKESMETSRNTNETTQPKLTTSEQMFKIMWNMKDMADIVKEQSIKMNV